MTVLKGKDQRSSRVKEAEIFEGQGHATSISQTPSNILALQVTMGTDKAMTVVSLAEIANSS